MPTPFAPAFYQGGEEAVLTTDVFPIVDPVNQEMKNRSVLNFLKDRQIPYVIAASGAKLSNTGSTTENTLVTVSIPANAMGPNGYLRVVTLWTAIGNTNTKTARVRFGGTEFMAIAHTTATQIGTHHELIIQNRNSLAAQITPTASISWSSQYNGAPVTGTVDTSAAQDLTITARCVTSGSDTLDLERYIVEVCYGA
jgi:hypothetical protein